MKRRSQLAVGGLAVLILAAAGFIFTRNTGTGALTTDMVGTGSCMVTPQAAPVTFGSAWVTMTGDQPVAFTSATLRDGRGLKLVEASLLPPGVLPQGTGIGLPFPPTTYALDPIQTSIWDQRILPGHDVRPAAERYPVSVGLKLADGVDHGTASGVVLNYSTGIRKRHVEIPVELLVVSKSAYSNCEKARTVLGLGDPVVSGAP